MNIRTVLVFFSILFVTTVAPAQQAPTAAALATKAFLTSLTPEQLTKTQYKFEDTLRFRWTNLPVGMVPRAGIAYGSLSDESRIAFHEVLTTFLGSQGYLKLTSIMQLDDILNVLYKDAFEKGVINQEVLTMTQNLKWDHGNFFISVWGDPSAAAPWGLNFGGHHIALSLTIAGKTISFSPLFIGTDPAQVKSGKYAGWRILAKEEDYGFSLVNFLTPEQKKKAILSQEVPKDIITNPKSAQRIDNYYGISAKEFNKDQTEVLRILIQEYLNNFEHETAHRLFDKLAKTGFSKVWFAWIGSGQRNKPHYYVINTPDFLIEYDNVGFQNDGNHIHAIVREKGNDFGKDILKEHYLTSEHHRK